MDNRTFTDLIADIQRVLSTRYVEDRSSPWGPYVRSDIGLRFEHLNRADQREVLTNDPFWGWYDDQGLTQSEQLAIVGNVLDGKPKEQWFEGAFDRAALEKQRRSEFRALLEDFGPHRAVSVREHARSEEEISKTKDWSREI